MWSLLWWSFWNLYIYSNPSTHRPSTYQMSLRAKVSTVYCWSTTKCFHKIDICSRINVQQYDRIILIVRGNSLNSLILLHQEIWVPTLKKMQIVRLVHESHVYIVKSLSYSIHMFSCFSWKIGNWSKYSVYHRATSYIRYVFLKLYSTLSVSEIKIF